MKTDKTVRNLVVKDSKGNVVPHQTIRYQLYENGAFSEIVLIFAADVSGLGYSTYYVTPCSEGVKRKAQETEIVPKKIETEYYRIALKQGCIS